MKNKSTKPHGFYSKAKRNFNKRKASRAIGDFRANHLYKFVKRSCESADVLYDKNEVVYDYENGKVIIPFRHYGVNKYGRIVLYKDIDFTWSYSKDGVWTLS